MASWTCKGCGRRFGRVNQSHECAPAGTVDQYFATRPPAHRRAYDAVVRHLRKLGPLHVEAVSVVVMFKRSRTFAEVRSRRDHLELAFLLSRQVDHPRIAKRLKLSTNRAAHYVPLRSASDVDRQVRAWLTESFASTPL
jgi:hypothetical protein